MIGKKVEVRLPQGWDANDNERPYAIREGVVVAKSHTANAWMVEIPAMYRGLSMVVVDETNITP